MVRLGWKRDRELPLGDPHGRYLLTGLGAAAEAFALGSAVSGQSVDMAFAWEPDQRLAASLTNTRRSPALRDIELGRAIPYRQTSRLSYKRRKVAAAILSRLEQEAHFGGCRLVIVTERRQIRRVARLVNAGTARNFADAGIFGEFAELLRFDPGDPAYTRDGLTLESLASSRSTSAAMRWALRPRTMQVLRRTRLHRLAARTQGRLMARSPAVALLATASPQPEDLFRGGGVMLRVWLEATRLGLSVQPMTAAMDHEATRAPLAELFGLGASTSPIMCFRLGYGPAAPRSPRLPLDELVVNVTGAEGRTKTSER